MPSASGPSPNPSPPPAPPTREGSTPPRASPVSWILLLVFLGAGWGYQVYATKEEATPEVRYTDLYTLLAAGKVDAVTLKGLVVSGQLKDEEKINGQSIKSFRTLLPAIEDRALLPLLR